MEESKELQGFYKIFRAVIYISVLMEFFEYAIDLAMLDHWGGILIDIHGRIKRWMIYNDGNLVYSKIATFLLICITCIGTRNKKHLEFDARRQVLYPLICGLFLIVFSVWLYHHTMETRLYTLPLNIIFYMAATLVGVILVHIALDNISKFIKEGLGKDRFNFENESFEQSEEKDENQYSVNIPMRYYYKGKFRKGWVSISNCFRGTWVVGTPGSGKTFSIIEPFIRQHSAKGFAMVVYDYKFPTLATKLYYHYKKNQKLGKVPKGCKFNIINFVDVEYSKRVNPIQAKYINNLAAASETAETLLESLQKGKKEGGGGSDQFFQTSAVNFLAACIYFFVNYEREPYDANGKKLYAEKRQDPQTKFWKPTGVVRDREGGSIVEPAYWLGKYSDMPHILSFLNESYQTIFEVLETATLPEWDDEEEIAPDAHELVQELYGIWDTLNQNKMLEAWHDAQQIREEALDLFSHGIVDLKTRAQIERLYWSITREINQIAGGLKHAPDEFRGLSKLLADKYFCNFSLFQSLPDSWAIDQIFPIMPIQRLDEKPDRSATLQDITCDSDGKIANFISTRNVAHYMPVHSLKQKEPYYVAVFLVGAYQEILGDMHNLFGDTNAVHVSVNEKGYNIEQIIDGETVAEVLDYVQYNPKKLVRTLETWVTKSVKEGKISVEEGKEFLSNYRSGLYGYTYLE